MWWQFGYALTSYHEETFSSGRVIELNAKETIKKKKKDISFFTPCCTPHLWGRVPFVWGLRSCLAHLSRNVVSRVVKKAGVLLTRRRLAPPLPPLHHLSPPF